MAGLIEVEKPCGCTKKGARIFNSERLLDVLSPGICCLDDACPWQKLCEDMNVLPVPLRISTLDRIINLMYIDVHQTGPLKLIAIGQSDHSF